MAFVVLLEKKWSCLCEPSLLSFLLTSFSFYFLFLSLWSMCTKLNKIVNELFLILKYRMLLSVVKEYTLLGGAVIAKWFCKQIDSKVRLYSDHNCLLRLAVDPHLSVCFHLWNRDSKTMYFISFETFKWEILYTHTLAQWLALVGAY